MLGIVDAVSLFFRLAQCQETMLGAGTIVIAIALRRKWMVAAPFGFLHNHGPYHGPYDGPLC